MRALISGVLVVCLVLLVGCLSSVVVDTPNGTYTTKTMFGSASLTFKGNTMIGSSELFGSGVCEYFIPGDIDSARSIKLTDVSTGNVEWHEFRYIKEADCIIFDGVTFCK